MSTYIKGIEGLRAVAVIAVIIFHLNPSWLPGGFAGVDVFFVVSGYVVALSLSKKDVPHLSTYLWGFYKRRFLRIYPALLFCLIASSVFVTFFVPKFYVSRFIDETAFFAFFGLSNFSLAFNPDSYFSPSTEFNPFVHTWSLGVEEQYYLIFPLIMFVWALGKKKYLIHKLFILSLAASACLSFINLNYAYYLLPSRFWELAAGAMLCILHLEQNQTLFDRNKYTRNLPIGFALLTIGVIFSEKAYFPFPWALVTVAGTVIIINAVVMNEKGSFLSGLLSHSISRYIGKLSYSLYLWHWPVFCFFRWTVGLSEAINYLSAIAITILISMFSYHVIELFFLNTKWIKSLSAKIVVPLSVILIVCLAYINDDGMSTQPRNSLSVTTDYAIWSPYTSIAKPTDESLPLFGRKLFVVGDSHASAYQKMLRDFSLETGIEVIIRSEGGCGITNLRKPVLIDTSPCKVKALNWIEQIKAQASSEDIIFLATLKTDRLVDQNAVYPADIKERYAHQFDENTVKKRKLALEESINLISEFSEVTNQIVIDAPKPVFNYVGFRCADWYTQNNPICRFGDSIDLTYFHQYRQSSMNSLVKIKERFGHVLIWDPSLVLCDHEKCSLYKDNKPLFFDADHLSGFGNQTIYPSFKSSVLEYVSH